VFRIEDGSLIELADGFLEAARGFSVPAGSVLVLTSASHLAWVGPGAYAQDFMAARQKLRATYRGGVEIIHGIPLLVSGVSDGASAAAISDFFLWLKQVTTGRNISQTIKHFVSKLPGVTVGPNGSGTPLAPASAAASPSAAVPYRIMLPADLSGRNNAVYKSKHEPNITIEPFNADFCDAMLAQLVSELNSKYMANLADPEKRPIGSVKLCAKRRLKKVARYSSWLAAATRLEWLRRRRPWSLR
jgi:hypothetical protein